MYYRKLYETNADFKTYVNKICKTYQMSVEEALLWLIVRNVGDEYAKRENSGIIPPAAISTMNAGCGGSC